MTYDRRYNPENSYGCKPTGDVCVKHDLPLECPHGCKQARPHTCKQLGTKVSK